MNAPSRFGRLADAALLAGAGLVFVLACAVRPHMMTGMINDEAVELLQAMDLPFDRAYYFVPSYEGGHVDLIESLPSYVNRGLWRLFGLGRRPVLVFHAACLAAAVWILGAAVRRVCGRPWGLLAAGMLGGSSYALFYDQLLTRNALSPFWGALAVGLAGVVLTAETVRSRAAALGFLAMVVALATMSYTSFKILAVPLYLALVVTLLLVRRWSTAALAMGSALVVVGLTVAALWATHTPLMTLVERGRYAMVPRVDTPRFGRHLWRTAALPIMRDPAYGDFITEETNDGYARAMLPAIVAPFFVLGLAGALARGRRAPVELFCAMTFLLAVPLFALGGPNLKHCLVLFPWVVALTVFGLRTAHGAVGARFGPRVADGGLAAVFAVFLVAEGRHLLRTIPGNERLAFMNGAAESTAEALVQHAAGRQQAALVGTLGLDVANLRVRLEATAQGSPSVGISWFPDRWSPELESYLKARPDAVILAQSEKDPRFFTQAAGLRPCYDRKLVKVGRYATAVFVPARPCAFLATATTPSP